MKLDTVNIMAVVLGCASPEERGEDALKDALESLVPDPDPADGWTYEPDWRDQTIDAATVLVVASGWCLSAQGHFQGSTLDV